MKLRRLAALLTSAAMLHLSAAAGAAACPPHGADGRHATTSHAEAGAGGAMGTNGHVMPMPAPGHAPVAPHAARAGAAPCEIPAPQHCCDVVVGCGADSAVASEQPTLTSNVLVAPRISDSLDDAPTSFAPVPEPPPPKA